MEDVFLIFCPYFLIFLAFFNIFCIKFKIVRFIHNIFIKLMYNNRVWHLPLKSDQEVNYEYKI